LDDGNNLQGHSIQEDSTLDLALRLAGDDNDLCVDFVDVEQTESLYTIPFSQNAPSFRLAFNGLNLEGKYENRQ
jgi:hypothetical protein